MAAPGCGSREPVLTYYNGEYAVSLRHPAGWRAEQSLENGVFRRTFRAPSAGTDAGTPVSATLVARRGDGSLEDDAREYLAGRTVTASREEKRGGATGRSYSLASNDGATRGSLLLLREADRLYGLFAHGGAGDFDRQGPVLDEMAKSLTLEKPSDYPVHRESAFGFSVRLPPSWSQTRRFAGGGTLLLQYQSPALAADRDRRTVHASLTLTVEPVEGGTSAQDYYDATLKKLGENFAVLKHEPWEGGFADVMRTETPLAMSNLKRFFRVEGTRGYSLAFESRDDVFPRVSRWYDQIASSLRTGDEMEK